MSGLQVLAMAGQGENVKVLFRRGQALAKLEVWGEAKDDLLAAAKLSPKDKAIRAAYEEAKAKVAENKAKEKQDVGAAMRAGLEKEVSN